MDAGRTTGKETGHNMEQAGRLWLEQQNLTFLTSNFHSRFGELDLVMMEEDGSLVFVEVKYRLDCSHGEGLEHVTRAKQRKIIRTAQAFLLRQGRPEPPCRFDVLSITGNAGELEFTWIRDAFQAS